MDTGPNNDVNLNNVNQVEGFDALSLNLSALSHDSNDSTEIASVIDNWVESIGRYLPIFDVQEQLDLFAG